MVSQRIAVIGKLAKAVVEFFRNSRDYAEAVNPPDAQGIVAVVQDGRVVMKFIAGSNGHKAPDLAAVLKEKGIIPLPEAHDLALQLGFGTRGNLVSMNMHEECLPGGELPSSFRRTFHQSGHNPRWSQGTAGYAELVVL